MVFIWLFTASSNLAPFQAFTRLSEIPKPVTVIKKQKETIQLKNGYTNAISQKRRKNIDSSIQSEVVKNLSPSDIEADLERGVRYLLQYFQFDQAEEAVISLLMDLLKGKNLISEVTFLARISFWFFSRERW